MLAGRTILIVDAEYLIALDLEQRLEALGAGPAVIATSAATAVDRAETWTDCALALIEIEDFLPQSMALAQTVRRAGIPVIAITADASLANGPNRVDDIPFLLKPIEGTALMETTRAVLAGQSQNE